MKEKLMELEMLMREVRVKMEELREMGIYILSANVGTKYQGYRINYLYGLPDIAEELGLNTSEETSSIEGHKCLCATHNGIEFAQWKFDDKPYKRRAQ